MRHFYTVVFYMLLPFVLLRLFWKGRQNLAYRKRIKERLGFAPANITPVDVWVHAVSFGEVVAAKSLIEEMLSQNRRVLVTTMTPTGSEQVLRLFKDRVQHQYIPYDFPMALKRFFKRYQPRVGVIMETEIWPNLFALAHQHQVRLFIANARISDGAFRAYGRVRWFFKPLWAYVTGVFAQSERDAERFNALGVPKAKLSVLGNMKSDLKIVPDVSQPVRFIKQNWGEERPVVIAASTHEGEENKLLQALKALQRILPHVMLLIAPRHPERFDAVYCLAETQAFKTARRSQPDDITKETEVIILDSMGELLGFYDLSDYAFIGGSFVPIGGHNVLEPMALGVPVFCGMFMQNSKELCDALLHVEAIQQVQNAEALVHAIGVLDKTPSLREAQIARATKALKANQGAVKRHLDAIDLMSCPR